MRLRPRLHPASQRLNLPDHLFTSDTSAFEQEVNQLRTHQGQSECSVINDGTILVLRCGRISPEVLGQSAIMAAYVKMKEVARICYKKHWLKQSNVLFIIGSNFSNNTSIIVLNTLARMDPRRFTSSSARAPILVRGLGALADACDSISVFLIASFHSAISEVVNYAKKVDDWMKRGGRGRISKSVASSRPPEPTGEDRIMRRQGVEGFPYYLGVNTLSEVATRGYGLRLEHSWKRVA